MKISKTKSKKLDYVKKPFKNRETFKDQLNWYEIKLLFRIQIKKIKIGFYFEAS